MDYEPQNAILPERVLTQIEQNASWHGYIEMGSYRSIDSELASAFRMQDAIPQLVREIRRLRQLVPEEQRVLVAVPLPGHHTPTTDLPDPPFPLPGVKTQ